MGNDSLKISMGNQTTKLDLGASATEAMQSIELKVGQNSIKIDQMGVTIKGMMIKVEGQVQTEVKGLMMQVSGDAMTADQGWHHHDRVARPCVNSGPGGRFVRIHPQANDACDCQ